MIGICGLLLYSSRSSSSFCTGRTVRQSDVDGHLLVALVCMISASSSCTTDSVRLLSKEGVVRQSDNEQ